MALQVWLPLNGDLRNQGLSSVTVTNSGATVDNAGKIGKCYNFTENQYMVLNNVPFSKLGNCSVSFWIYIGSNEQWLPCTGGNAGSNTGQYFLATSGSAAFYHNQIGSNTVTIYRDGVVGTTPLSYGAWHHYCITGLDLSSWTGITINHYGTYTSWNFTGKINDFRIYDHCLTPAEVKEISLGLVLHYKLDDPYAEPTINYFPIEENYGSWSSYGFGSHGIKTEANGYTPNGTGKYCIVGSNATSRANTELARGITAVSLSTNSKATFSCYVRGVGSTIGRSGFLHVYNNNGTNTQSDTVVSFYLTDKWTRVSGQFTWRNTANSSSGYSCYVVCPIVSGETFEFCEPQFEIKDHVTPYVSDSRIGKIVDSSGYGRHGTITGNLIASSSTGRYKCSTNFPDSACSITIGSLSSIIPEGNFTFNVWFKKITGEWSSKGYETIFGGPSGFELEAKRGATNSPELVMWNWSQSNTVTYSLDQWNMVTFCRDSSGTKLYLNGEQKATGVTGSIPSGTYFIGAWRSATEQNYRGYLADARLYSTVLSAEDVKRLYNTGALIDKKGNVHSYEIEETDAGRELMITEWTANYGSTSSRYTKYNHGIYFNETGASSGSDFIEINPTGNKYIYDTTVSVSTGNMFYIGFERYDANKTSTSNNSCVYIVAVKPSSDIVKQRFTGVVDLSNSLSGPCKYIRLRILNGWSGSDSGSTNIATVHQLSLREVPTSTDSKTRLLKTGVFQTDLLREDDTTAKIEKNIDMSINEFIEI